MSTTQAAEILSAHNAWRRHNSSDDLPVLPMQDPLDVGRAIDLAVALLRAEAARSKA